MDWLSKLFDPTLATPRRVCSGLSADWITLHVVSDLLIWLAYISIPLILLVSVRRNTLTGLRVPVVLFALFILVCGTSHLVESLMFEHPVYYLSGVVKGVTAAVSWLTVFVVVPVVPKVLARLGPADDEPVVGDRLPGARSLVYAFALLVGCVTVLLRYALNPVLGTDHPYILDLLAVVVVAWYGGFRPALVATAVTAGLSVYLFVPPLGSLVIGRFSDALALALFLFTGAAVAVLGQLQQVSRRRLLGQMRAASDASRAAERERQASERALGQLDALVRNAPYAIAFLDDELRYLRVNDAVAAATGLAVAAHPGRSLLDVQPDAPAEVVAEFRAVLAGGPPVIGRIVHAGGLVWEVTAFAVPLDAGRVGLGVMSKDVTERHTAAERVRESEGKFRAMADGIPQLAWMAKPDGHIFWYNQRWYEYTGTTFDQMEGWGWERVHDPEELKRVLTTWPRALATGEPFEDTFPLRRHDGQMRWHLTRAVPTKDAAGNVLLWFGTNTDVTAQRELEAGLREREGRFRQLAEAMPQIVWMTRPDGHHEYYNARWYEYTGKTVEESIGFGWADPLHPDDAGRSRRRWEHSTRTGDPYEIEYRFRRSDGVYRWFLGRANPVRDESGAVVRWLGTCTDIDDRKQAADALAESEAYMRGVLDNSPDCIMVLAPDGRLIEVNDPGLRALGTDDITPLLGKGLADLWPADGRERVRRAVAAAAAGTADRFSGWNATLTGQPRFWDVIVAPIPDASGRVVRLVGVSRDVTEQKRADEAVREKASHLLQLTEGMPFLMWACRPTGECDYLSRQWIEYTGAGLGEQLGYGWLAAVHPDDRGKTDAAWHAAVAGTAAYDIEYRLRRHDGEYRWFAVRGIPLRDHAGGIVKWYGSCADVDDRKRQEETLERLVTERTAALHQANAELVQQQAFVDAILDNVAEGIVACDTAGRLKLFNASTRHMHALPPEPLSAEGWAAHYRLYEADGLTPMPTDRVPLVRAWRGEAVKDAEMVIRPADPHADERYVVCSGQPLRTPAGEPFGAVVSMRDMTQRREYERQLLRTTAALEASNDDLEKFAYIASHDLQEPLRKIQAFGDRLATKFREPLAEQGRDYIDRMLDSATRMRRLIEDLLAFSRVNTRSKRPEAVPLGEVLRGVLDDLSEQLARTGGRVEVGPLPTLPADAGQLRQVFQNLIGNALKFHRPDAPPVVRVAAEPFAAVPAADRPAGEGWRITLSDNGIGFEPQHADRIFELFQRLHGRSKFEGTGLGLAIVKKIVTRHGGEIRARSSPGGGATFTIDWPSTPAEGSSP